MVYYHPIIERTASTLFTATIVVYNNNNNRFMQLNVITIKTHPFGYLHNILGSQGTRNNSSPSLIWSMAVKNTSSTVHLLCILEVTNLPKVGGIVVYYCAVKYSVSSLNYRKYLTEKYQILTCAILFLMLLSLCFAKELWKKIIFFLIEQIRTLPPYGNFEGISDDLLWCIAGSKQNQIQSSRHSSEFVRDRILCFFLSQHAIHVIFLPRY